MWFARRNVHEWTHTMMIPKYYSYMIIGIYRLYYTVQAVVDTAQGGVYCT